MNASPHELDEYRMRLHAIATELGVEVEEEWTGDINEAVGIANEAAAMADARADYEADLCMDEYRAERYDDVQEVDDVFDALCAGRD